MLRHLRVGLLTVGLSLFCMVTSTHAADLDKLLPDDTETVMSVNIRQILDSAIVKKYGMEKLKDQLDNQGEAKEYLKDFGLDPFKDIDTITMGFPANNEAEKGLIIINGKFNQEKIEAKASEMAKDKPDIVKSHKEGGYKIFEINAPNSPQSAFAAVASKNMILVADSKAHLLEALDKNAGKKTSKLKNKELAAMVAKIDAKQSFWVLVPAVALEKITANNEDAKKFFEGVDAVTAGVTITDKVVLRVGISNKDADAAKEMQKKIKKGLNFLKVAVGLDDRFAPLGDALDTVKSTANDKMITLEAEMSADVIEKLSKLANDQ